MPPISPFTVLDPDVNPPGVLWEKVFNIQGKGNNYGVLLGSGGSAQGLATASEWSSLCFELWVKEKAVILSWASSH